mmetsp:Transcript_19921/g.60184  ORF Transcript_19921/g.60184 Transcript_19921/m.60184 type:complete len:269 (-) Transcript_19921:969-1775(-)
MPYLQRRSRVASILAVPAISVFHPRLRLRWLLHLYGWRCWVCILSGAPVGGAAGGAGGAAPRSRPKGALLAVVQPHRHLRLQLLRQLLVQPRERRPVLRELSPAGLHDVHVRRGHGAGHIQPQLLVHHVVHHLHSGHALVRRGAGKHLPHDNGKAVHIGGLCHAPSVQELRRHVWYRSKCLSADVSGLVFKHSGQAKICQLGNEATWISGGRLEQDVLWLQVRVQQSQAMQIRHAINDVQKSPADRHQVKLRWVGLLTEPLCCNGLIQ